jgi:excisionase family DNA binding protein
MSRCNEGMVLLLGEALIAAIRQAVADAIADAIGAAAPGPADTAVAVSVAGAATRLGLGTTTTKKLIAKGELRSILVEGRRLVPVEAIQDFVRRLDDPAS